MALEAYFIICGQTYNINNGAPFYLNAWDGLGPLPVRRLQQGGPLQDGVTDRGWRGQPRFFALRFLYASTGLDNRTNVIRRTLLRYLAPRNAALALRLVFDGTPYQIDCFPLEEGGTAQAEEVLCLTQTTARFYAPDPTFYNPVSQTETWVLDVTNDLILPFTTPFILGTNIINATRVINYAGDVDAFPVLRLRGPLNAPQVLNETTGYIIAFRGGTGIALGEEVTIDLRYGVKTVTTNLGGGSRLADIDPNRDDLARFTLAAAVDGSGTRANTLRVVATGAAAGQSGVSITFNTRYAGI
jgi:hypothetical protein